MLLKSLGAVDTKLAKYDLWCHFFNLAQKPPLGHSRGA